MTRTDEDVADDADDDEMGRRQMDPILKWTAEAEAG